MDRMLESKKIDSMKQTMLMHEQIFKKQVQELHRLYDVQKKLMHELKNAITRKKEIIISQAFCAKEDPREHSSCSGMPIKFDIEIPSEEKKDLESRDEETDVEVELTLSIGHCTRKKRSKSHLDYSNTLLPDFDQSNKVGELGFSSMRVHEGEEEYGEPSSIVSSSSVHKNSQPHWLREDLSLNKT
ncbi:hypothetical protein ACJIZ3_025644 [Penstemon smallii]|uniref:Uncharacterized protein n=1 Tax=Penstemon smallii TaxID=265156 RepID=A0ABD3TYI7_9LAMI